jgi:ATP phosphoribosyltransferase regulatory subunit
LGAATPIPAVGFSVWVETLTQAGRKPAAKDLSGAAS